MKDHLKNFTLSPRARRLLQDEQALKRGIRGGISPQELLEISDSAMNDFFCAALQLFKGRRFSEAAKAYYFLITLNAGVYKYWLGYAMASQLAGDIAIAIQAYEMAAACSEGSPVPFYYLAECFIMVHQYEEAKQALECAIECAKDDNRFTDLFEQAISAKTRIKQL